MAQAQTSGKAGPRHGTAAVVHRAEGHSVVGLRFQVWSLNSSVLLAFHNHRKVQEVCFIFTQLRFTSVMFKGVLGPLCL